MTEQTPGVKHLPKENKFIIEFEGQPAVLMYEMGKDGTLMVMHTEVPPAHNGQGHAGRLAKKVLVYAQDNNLKVMPYCTFMATYIKRHKQEYKDVVSPEFNL